MAAGEVVFQTQSSNRQDCGDCEISEENSRNQIMLLTWLNSPPLCPKISTNTLMAICQMSKFGEPAFSKSVKLRQEYQPSSSAYIPAMVFQVTCSVDSLMCSALATSLEVAKNAASLRMAVTLMRHLDQENIVDLLLKCDEALVGEEVANLLRILLPLAKTPKQHVEVETEAPDVDAKEDTARTAEAQELTGAGSNLLQLLAASNPGFGNRTSTQASADEVTVDLSRSENEKVEDSTVASKVLAAVGMDYVTEMKHFCDHHGFKSTYVFTRTEDPPHQQFMAELTLTRSDGNPMERLSAVGHGRNKKIAKHMASKEMLNLLGVLQKSSDEENPLGVPSRH